MSLVFSALVPHPPLLLPSIGREHAKLLEKTWHAYSELGEALRMSGAQTIVIITPHLPYIPGTFVMNFSPEYKTHFLEFGDLSEPREFFPDHLLIEKIRHSSRLAGCGAKLMSEEHLDYGSGVPLFFLPDHAGKMKIVVVGPSGGGPKDQFAFGRVVKDAVLRSRHKTAVICSADLSHRHSSDSPSGFTKIAKEFDEMIMTNLSAGNASPILQMDRNFVAEAHSCGYRGICLFLGIMDKIDYVPELLSYEAPFGVGYAAMRFNLK